MYDVVVRTLTNVRYILDLKKNMISLGTLDFLGYSYLAKDGIIKMAEGAKVATHTSKCILEYVHLDVCGPVTVFSFRCLWACPFRCSEK